jgi:putative ABC transport system substrate-binding protein
MRSLFYWWELILNLATRRSAPAKYFDRIFAASGGLMSYAASLEDVFLQAGIYVGRILKEARRSSRSATDQIRTGRQS